MSPVLLTLAEYEALSPRQKGYACYMQAALPGSEIPDLNPYPKGSVDAEQFAKGQFDAILEAQDMP